MDSKDAIFIAIVFFIILVIEVSTKKFVTPGTPVMEGLIDLHDHIFFFLILILVFVCWLFFFLLRRYIFNVNYIFFFENFLLNKFSSYAFLILGIFVDDEEIALKDKAIKAKAVNSLDLIDSWHMVNPFSHFMASYSAYYRDTVKFLLSYRNYIHHELLEIIWTILPAFVLVLVSIPSFALLYAMDELLEVPFVVKVVGYQWFWSYEYTRQEIYSLTLNAAINSDKGLYAEHANLNYTSILTTEDDLVIGNQRLLEVDHELILPRLTPLRLVIVSGDVLHSWAVPAFGLKVDAVPGRLSHVPLYIDYSGLFYGQCSELCGVGHGFMPIVVKVVDWGQFNAWYWTFFFGIA